MKKSMLVIFLTLIISMFSVSALPATVDTVQIDGISLLLNDVNRLSLERGDEIEVKVRLTAQEAASNIEITAFISGYEFNSDDPLSDTSDIFDLDAQSSIVKRLMLKIPDKAEKDDYRLRILIADRNSDPIIQNYRIRITAPRHAVQIRDVIFNPENSIEAGRSLLASVRVKNMGDRDEDSVKVTMSIPDLQLSVSDFIDELNKDDSKTSEELFFRIPPCAKAGTYPVDVTVEYSDGLRKTTSEESITIKQGDSCGTSSTPTTPASQPITLTVSDDVLTMKSGSAGGEFTLTISNPGSDSRAFVLSTQGLDGLDSRFDPSNMIVVDGGETQSILLHLVPRKDTTLGTHDFTLSLADSNGKVLKSVALTANVLKGTAKPTSDTTDISPDLQKSLEIGAIVLLVIALIVGIAFLFMRTKGPEEPGQMKTYY